MCEWRKSGENRIDPCMRPLIRELQIKGIKTLACCCGHGKYPRTIIVEKDEKRIEYYSGVEILRKKRFYRRDAQGIYYIPELV